MPVPLSIPHSTTPTRIPLVPSVRPWLITLFLWAICLNGVAMAGRQPWLSPAALVASAGKDALFVVCSTGNTVQKVDLASEKVVQSWSLTKSPTGLALSPDGRMLAVTCADPESEVVLIDVTLGQLSQKLATGHTSVAPVFSPDGQRLYVCNSFNNDVSVFNLPAGQALARIPVKREPVAAAITRDGRFLLVANRLPVGPANARQVAARVTVIDTTANRVADELALPSGSTGLCDISISPDGKFAVVTHILARYHLPTTQLDRGWVNTNAKTIIGLNPPAVLNTVLLDSVDRGAANPWGTAWSEDSRTLVVAHAGAHEVSIINFYGVIQKLSTNTAKMPAGSHPYASTRGNNVPNDLAFLVDLRTRRSLPDGDNGPRGVAVIGGKAYTANYFSDTLSVVDLTPPYYATKSIPLGPKPKLSAARTGEMYFNDARICFQTWQSCASCHPGDARVDALNWDLLNDGIGNPKNNKSLLLAHKTPPSMSLAARESAEAAVRAGISAILFTVQPPEVANAIDEYLKSLRPVPSPLLVRGKLSSSAARGAKIFRSREAGCASCHPDPLFTDLQSYDVGTAGEFDRDAKSFDTPTLVELWRTAPYLHDGSAYTVREVIVDKNNEDQHGKTSHLTAEQVGDLCNYLLSL